MVDLNILKKHGLSTETLKETFTAKDVAEKPAAWIKRISERIQNGRDFCFSHYRLYYGIDQAFDVAFRQLSPTLASSIANQMSNDHEAVRSEEILKTAIEWGLTHLITNKVDPKTGKQLPGKEFNLPIFWHCIVPLAPAYTMIRVSKQVNDRNRDPYLKYEPFRDTSENRFKCDVITDWLRVMTKNYGYQHIGNQAILKAAMYGDQIMFPQDEWHEEKQLHYVKGKEKERIVREGVPYYFPHPSRTYWDRSYPAPSMNTDTGCKWAGNWRVQRSGDIRQNRKIWNRDKLLWPAKDLKSVFPAFFNTVYSSCTLKFPQTMVRQDAQNREQNIEDNFYTSGTDDYAMILTDHFEEIIPKEWGLGDYEHPVWMRVIMANDTDPIYITPLPSIAPIYFGYSPEDNRLLGTSLTMELMWAQDHVSNLMTQTLLSVKQNLANLTFVNEDVVDEKIISQLENLGEAQFRKLNLFRYSDYKFRMGQNEKKFESVQFPKHDVASIMATINALLALLERVNVISSQEVGAQASHEQSAEEQRNIRASTSVKANYFAFQIDLGLEAWKRQLYNYSMAYADEEVWGEVPADRMLTTERLNKLGFTVEEDGDSVSRNGRPTKVVKGKKTAIALQQFTSPRLENNRLEDGAMATAMVQLLGVAFKEQIVAEAIGSEQAINLFNEVMKKFGFPEDFRLNAEIDPQQKAQEQANQIQEQMNLLMGEVQKLVEGSSQQVMQQVTEAMKPVADAATTALNASASNTERLNELFNVFSATIGQQPSSITQPNPLQPDPRIPNAEILPSANGASGNPAPQDVAPII